MNLVTFRIEVPMADVDESILNLLAREHEVAVKLVKDLDEAMGDWNWTLEMYEYFQRQKAAHDEMVE